MAKDVDYEDEVDLAEDDYDEEPWPYSMDDQFWDEVDRQYARLKEDW